MYQSDITRQLRLRNIISAEGFDLADSEDPLKIFAKDDALIWTTANSSHARYRAAVTFTFWRDGTPALRFTLLQKTASGCYRPTSQGCTVSLRDFREKIGPRIEDVCAQMPELLDYLDNDGGYRAR